MRVQLLITNGGMEDKEVRERDKVTVTETRLRSKDDTAPRPREHGPADETMRHRLRSDLDSDLNFTACAREPGNALISDKTANETLLYDRPYRTLRFGGNP